ncbi:MAG TPA: peptidoglycan-binding domain-containing protein [Candidatus Limnocylindrales bacterium]|nr:peptidoglycan-binding domain-containing protein [Candidatus Limnocylindrales bacterium]
MTLRLKNLVLLSTVLALSASLSFATTPTTKHTGKSTHASAKHRKVAKKGSWKKKGQQGIQPERAREIQAALIKQNYLTGEPTGEWDSRSQAAMVRFQSDNGWQTKVVPDSRALIKLGLGPIYTADMLVNPDAANTVAASGGSAPASGIASRDKQ